MQRNVVDTVISSFSRLRPGMRWQSPLGLTVCQLIDNTAGAVARRPFAYRAGHLSWREMGAPDPRRLRIVNRAPTSVVVEAGAVTDGGMAMRALRCCVVIPANSEASVAVEPLGGRWWDEGPVIQQGQLDPVAMALVFQTTLVGEPLASSAVTSLYSFPPVDMVMDGAAAPLYRVSGWLLEDDDGIVGGWILEHTHITERRPHRS